MSRVRDVLDVKGDDVRVVTPDLHKGAPHAP